MTSARSLARTLPPTLLLQILSSSERATDRRGVLTVEETHVVKEDAAMIRRHVKEIHVWASATVKPCLCVGVFEARCIFSEFCRKSCTARFSRTLGLATRSGAGGGMSRHPQVVPVLDKMLCPFQWAPSDRSSDRVPGTVASFSWYLDLFLRFSADQ